MRSALDFGNFRRSSVGFDSLFDMLENSNFGGEVVEGAGVGAADVHARPAAHRLEAFEDLDRGSVVAVGRGRSGSREKVGHCFLL